MSTRADLHRALLRIDGRGYKAYKEIQGAYDFGEFRLFIDHVQGDPFAAPSRLRVRVPQAVAGYPTWAYQTASRRIGLENYLAEAFAQAASRAAARRGSGKSGLIAIDAPGQALLERTAVRVTAGYVEARFVVGLPAQGRRVLGRQAAVMLCEDLPEIVGRALRYGCNNADLLAAFVQVNEDAEVLRLALRENGLVAFVADGSVLPRRSGVDQRPLSGPRVVPFQSPPERRLTLRLPNAGEVTGLGVPEGVTLIVGGGFHGKSTLLNALARGVYNHRPGDGRERVVADATAVKIRAEDGRSVVGVDISPFINNLPFGQDTRAFTTENASGSTSQAANIMEALELGSRLLLIDEDTAATNFMIRDERMQRLIAKDKEPITPFIDKVRQLYEDLGISTVLVVGGSGDYFDVADTIIAMDTYRPLDLTARARAIAEEAASSRRPEGGDRFGRVTPRVPLPESLDPRRGRREVSVKVRGLHHIEIGRAVIDLSAVGQLVDVSQTRAVAHALVYAWEHYMDGRRTVDEVLETVMRDVGQGGLDVLTRQPVGDLAAFRKFELGAALNRLRSLRVRAAPR